MDCALSKRKELNKTTRTKSSEDSAQYLRREVVSEKSQIMHCQNEISEVSN